MAQDSVFVPSIYALEWKLLLAFLIASLLVPHRFGPFDAANQLLSRIARKKVVSLLIILGVVLLGRLALVPKLGIPRPAIADEFGYLLTADTFVHGRLTNPPSQYWKHFETFNEIQHPTYQSQYPIGTPIVLAIGQWLFGNPWWGVYFTTGFMCAVLTWMLRSWVKPYWAFIGGLAVAIRFGLFSYWMNSFWGGSLAALGGCLIFGALPRIVPNISRFGRACRSSLFANGVFLSLGFATLATTRPYEGLVVSIPAGIIVLRWLVRHKGNELKRVWLQVALPCLLVMGATAGITLYYQHQVTGHAFESPYDVALKQIHISRPFIFQEPMPVPHYDNLEMRFLYLTLEQMAENLKTPWGFLESLRERSLWYWKFYSGPLLTLPFLAVVFTFRCRSLRLVWFILAFLLVAVLLENWIQVHYLAPGFCLYILLMLEGARRLRMVRIGSFAVGCRLLRALPILCVTLLVLRVFAYTANSMESAAHWPPNWAYSTRDLTPRNKIEDSLLSTTGMHLVLVRYRYPFHNPHEEFVFNQADLNTTKILWARSMSVTNNCALVQSYPDRKLWIVDNWGTVIRFFSVNEAAICDPKNMIYEQNHPSEYYTTSLARHDSQSRVAQDASASKNSTPSR